MNIPLTTWRKLIAEELAVNGESWDDVIRCNVRHPGRDGPGLDVEFYDGYGGRRGSPFTAWTAARVYFPAVHDGKEWCASVPRNPCDETVEHVGGE